MAKTARKYRVSYVKYERKRATNQMSEKSKPHDDGNQIDFANACIEAIFDSYSTDIRHGLLALYIS